MRQNVFAEDLLLTELNLVGGTYALKCERLLCQPIRNGEKN